MEKGEKCVIALFRRSGALECVYILSLVLLSDI